MSYRMIPYDPVTDVILDHCEQRHREWQSTPRWRPFLRRRRFWLWMSTVARLDQHVKDKQP